MPRAVNERNRSSIARSDGRSMPGRRLVEHQDLRLGGERARHQHALALAARERVKRPLASSSASTSASAARVRSTSALSRSPAGADEAVAAHERDLVGGEREADVDRGALRHVAEARAPAARGSGWCRAPAATGRASCAPASSCRCRWGRRCRRRRRRRRRGRSAAAPARRDSRPRPLPARRGSLTFARGLAPGFDQRLEALHRRVRLRRRAGRRPGRR